LLRERGLRIFRAGIVHSERASYGKVRGCRGRPAAPIPAPNIVTTGRRATPRESTESIIALLTGFHPMLRAISRSYPSEELITGTYSRVVVRSMLHTLSRSRSERQTRGRFLLIAWEVGARKRKVRPQRSVSDSRLSSSTAAQRAEPRRVALGRRRNVDRCAEPTPKPKPARSVSAGTYS